MASLNLSGIASAYGATTKGTPVTTKTAAVTKSPVVSTQAKTAAPTYTAPVVTTPTFNPLAAGLQATADARAAEALIAQRQGTPINSVTATDLSSNPKSLLSMPTPTDGFVGSTPYQMPVPTTNINGVQVPHKLNADGSIMVDANGQPVPEVQQAPVTDVSQVKDAGSAKSFLTTLFGQQANKGAVEGQLNQSNQVNEKQQASINSYNAYNQAKLNFQQKIEALNNSGVSKEQQAPVIAEMSRRFNAELANLGIVAEADANNYKGALDIVDRKLKAEFDPIQQSIDNVMKFIEVNNNDLTERQKFDLTTKANADQKKLDTLSDAKQNAYQAVITSGKSSAEQTKALALIDKAGDTNAVAKATVGFGISAVQQASINSANRANGGGGSGSGGVSGAVIRTDANGNKVDYSGALSVILGSGKFTKDQKSSVVNAINRGEDPVAVIKNQAKSIMSGAEQTQVQKLETARGAMQDLQSSLQSYYDAGGSTNIFSGNYEKALNKLGTLNDPALVNLGVQIAGNLQTYRNAVSGTAYSVQEGKEIASVFPGINKSQGLNQAIINGRLSSFDSQIDNSYRTVLGSTYDSIKTQPVNKTVQIDPKKEDVFNSIINPNATQKPSFLQSFSNLFNLNNFKK